MISRARVIRWMRDMEAERQIEAMRLRGSDSASGHYTAKGPADHPDYKPRVAEPTMDAVDLLPKEWRTEAIAEFGYVDVYRAWLRKWPLALVKEQAERMGGRFVL